MSEYYFSAEYGGYIKDCPTCETIFIGGQTRPEADNNLSFYFAQDHATRDGFYGTCKKCVSRRQRNKRDGRECDAEKLLHEQGGKCGICQKPLTFHRDKYDAKVSAYVDHSHETDKVRGILCVRCNSMLSNRDWLLKALAYLEKYGE